MNYYEVYTLSADVDSVTARFRSPLTLQEICLELKEQGGLIAKRWRSEEDILVLPGPYLIVASDDRPEPPKEKS